MIAFYHLIGFILILGYSQNYYFHLSAYHMKLGLHSRRLLTYSPRASQEQRALDGETKGGC